MRYAWLLLAAVSLVPGSAQSAPVASRTATAITTECVRLRECPGGDLLADVLRRAGQADAALVSASQFRTGVIRPGKVTVADVAGLLIKSDRPWVVSTLTGRGLRAALERSLSRVPEESAYYLQVAGLRVVFDPKAPLGRRVKGLSLDGGPVVDGGKYKVAMPDDLARGGSGYFTIPDFTEANIVTRGGAMDEAIGQFLAATPVLNYDATGRIVPGE